MFHTLFVGPHRTSPPAIEVEELHIDVCLLSHTHYDHLDIPSAMRIGNKALWYVPVLSNLVLLLRLHHLH